MSTTPGTPHRHKDSRLKWTTDELPHTHELPTHPADALTDAQVKALLLLVGGGGGTTPPAPPADTAAPIIGAITVTAITQTGAVVGWTLNEPATGQVEYGLTTAYGSTTTVEPSLLLAHSQGISGLSAGTYHYRVKSADAAGNLAVSADRMFTTGAVPVPPPPTPITTVPANGDLQAYLTAAANGTTLKVTPGATYILSGSLRSDNRAGFGLDLTGATIRTNLQAGTKWATTQELLYLKGWTDSWVRGGTIYGSHNAPGTYYTDGREFQAGIAWVGGRNNTVYGTIIRDNMGDGFGVYGSGGAPAVNTTFLGCESHGNGRMGIAVVNAQTVLWDGGAMSNQAWVCFEIEPDPNGTDTVNDVIFRNATISGQGKHLFAVSMIGGCHRILCENMHVLAGPNRGIWSFIEPKNGIRNTDITFRNNVGEQAFAEDPGWRAVLLAKDTDRLVVTGNRQPVSNSSMVGVLLDNSPNPTINGNVFAGASAEWALI